MADTKKYNSDGRSAEDKALDKFAEMMIERISSIQQDWKKKGDCHGRRISLVESITA